MRFLISYIKNLGLIHSKVILISSSVHILLLQLASYNHVFLSIWRFLEIGGQIRLNLNLSSK